MYLIPVLCALVGALFLALGSERQAAGVRGTQPPAAAIPSGGTVAAPPAPAATTPTAERARGALHGALAMLRSPVWLLGGVLMLAGIALNVIALANAPLSVVQPIGAIAVAITTVLHARTERLRIGPRTWAAVGACMAGSVGFVLVTMQATKPTAVPTDAQERETVLIAWVVVAAGAVAATWLSRRASAIVPIVAAGVLYGFVAVCVRLTAVRILEGRLPSWSTVAVLAAAALLGVYFVQTAYRYGPPDLVVAGLTVVDPMVGVLVGVTVLDELRPHLPLWVASALMAAAVVATVGIIQLSRSHPDVVARREAR